MKIFYIADITGKVGVWAVKKTIADIKRRYSPHFIIAHANMTTGAGGLGKQHAGYLRKMGIDCIVGSDCIFQKKDLVENLAQMPFVLRPLNLPTQSPGKGWRFFTAKTGETITVVSLLGRVGHYRLLADNPFTAIQDIIPKIQEVTPYIIVDFSSFATAEKQTMAFFLAGKVSALVGSGTRAATADCQVMAAADDSIPAIRSCRTESPQAELSYTDLHTGYITDAGRSGSFDSVGGHAPAAKIREYRTGLFEYPQETWRRVCVQGIMLDLSEQGSTQTMEPVRIELPECKNQSAY